MAKVLQPVGGARISEPAAAPASHAAGAQDARTTHENAAMPGARAQTGNSVPRPTKVFRVNRPPGASLGIVIQTSTSGDACVQSAQGPAAQAGIRPGLIIVAVNGVSVAGRGEAAVVEVRETYR
eukprot:SAG31_NODE_14315_length_814_cov_1.356643_1_plen_124_part_00